MTQCHLKLRYSVTSLPHTLDLIEIAKKGCPVDRTLDRLTLKLIECKATTYLDTGMSALDRTHSGTNLSVFQLSFVIIVVISLLSVYLLVFLDSSFGH